MSRLIRAIDFSANAHKNQRSKDINETPYINHPIRVARLISESGCNDEDILISALLHDVVEDTFVTIDEIEREFGYRVRSIVEQVTDDKSLPKVTRKMLQVEKAPTKCFGAKMVKLADKLDNLSQQDTSPPESWSDEIKMGYFVWSYYVVDGLRRTSQYLEERLDRLFDQKLITKDPSLLKEQLESYYEILK